MFKCMALLRKRADITRDEFIDYYQSNHSVLIRKLLPGIIDYRRILSIWRGRSCSRMPPRSIST